MTTGAGKRPPSVPISIQGGPAVVGSGTPPALPSAAHIVCCTGMPAVWLPAPKFGQQPNGSPVPFSGFPLPSKRAVAKPINKVVLVIGVICVHNGKVPAAPEG